MNKRNLLILWGILAVCFPLAAAADCTNPCGPEEILSCVGQSKTPPQTAKEVYDTWIFGTKNADGFCNGTAQKAKKNSQGDWDITPLQEYYWTTFCSKEKGTYASYENFIGAYNKMKAKPKLKTFGTLACEGTAEDRKKEMANMFATMAQETTSAISYTNDGVYFRYENGALATCFDPIGPCMSLDSKPSYYVNAGQHVIAVDVDNSTRVFTEYYWDSGTIENGKVSGMKTILTGDGPITMVWDQGASPPLGYTLKKLNDEEVVKPGYWVGMGPKQLTSNSMMSFFGWYYNHMVDKPEKKANLQTFIERFLVDGELAMEGGFWFWMFRVSGSTYPTIHKVLASKGDVCHDIAIVTRMVNGGCNNYQQEIVNGKLVKGRKDYYQYFLEKVFGMTLKAETAKYEDTLLNSLQCKYLDEEGKEQMNPNDLQKFCYSQ
jgi:hypothetical protein